MYTYSCKEVPGTIYDYVYVYVYVYGRIYIIVDFLICQAVRGVLCVSVCVCASTCSVV